MHTSWQLHSGVLPRLGVCCICHRVCHGRQVSVWSLRSPSSSPIPLLAAPNTEPQQFYALFTLLVSYIALSLLPLFMQKQELAEPALGRVLAIVEDLHKSGRLDEAAGHLNENSQRHGQEAAVEETGDPGLSHFEWGSVYFGRCIWYSTVVLDVLCIHAQEHLAQVKQACMLVRHLENIHASCHCRR